MKIEDTRGWEKSSDPYMRKAAYYADIARKLQAQVDALTSGLTASNMSEIIINDKRYVRDYQYLPLQEQKP